MKEYVKILCLVLALVMVLPMAFGCFKNKDGNDSETVATEPVATEGTQSDETPTAPVLKINGVNFTDYTIVYSRKSESGGEKAAKYFNQKINELYGSSLKLDTKAQGDRYEILIALDGGDSAIKAAYEKNPTCFIGVSGKKIVILGVNYSALCKAIDTLLEKTTSAHEISVTENQFIELKTHELNVMSYYVADGSKAKIVETVLANNVDVLGLQGDSENYSSYFVENLKNYDVYKGDVDQGNYIYWRKDKYNLIKKNCYYLNERQVTPQSKDENRTMVYVILEDKVTGKQFIFVNLKASEATENIRKNQLAALTDLIVEKINKDNLPIVLLGNFNSETTSSSSAILDFTMKNPDFGMASRICETKGDVGGTVVTDFTTREKNIVDHILVTTDNISTKYYTVVDNATDGEYPATHLPILAKLTVY